MNTYCFIQNHFYLFKLFKTSRYSRTSPFTALQYAAFTLFIEIICFDVSLSPRLLARFLLLSFLATMPIPSPFLCIHLSLFLSGYVFLFLLPTIAPCICSFISLSNYLRFLLSFFLYIFPFLSLPSLRCYSILDSPPSTYCYSLPASLPHHLFHNLSPMFHPSSLSLD